MEDMELNFGEIAEELLIDEDNYDLNAQKLQDAVMEYTEFKQELETESRRKAENKMKLDNLKLENLELIQKLTNISELQSIETSQIKSCCTIARNNNKNMESNTKSFIKQTKDQETELTDLKKKLFSDTVAEEISEVQSKLKNALKEEKELKLRYEICHKTFENERIDGNIKNWIIKNTEVKRNLEDIEAEIEMSAKNVENYRQKLKKY